jgi:integrase
MKERSLLTTSLKTSQSLEHYRATPAGPYLDAFLGWLEARGYQRPPYPSPTAGRPVQAFAALALKAYGQYLQELQRLRSPSGRFSHLFVGARHFGTFLATPGVVTPAAAVIQAPPEPELLRAVRRWMRPHRGTTDATLNGDRLPILALLHALGEQPEQLTATALRTFVLDRAGQQGIGGAQTVVTAVRMFVRLLIAIGRCTPGLDQALPPLAHWRFASLPTYLPAETVERGWATCDRTTATGVRDRAGLLLLARLGRRAGAVAALPWRDLDWHEGPLGGAGKQRRATRLPLPQEVGEALLPYVEQARPRVASSQVVLTTSAPRRPRPAKTVTASAARARRRAQVAWPPSGAHGRRPTPATTLRRPGVSLPSIGAVLRHTSVETTAPYATVDVDRLHLVARPWPWPMVSPLVTARAHRMEMAHDRGVLPLLGSRQIGIRQATGHRCTPLSR